jgi:hypothetical protein
MSELKYFTRSGNQYTMKRQYGFSLIVIVVLAGAAIAGMYNNMPELMWICGVLTILFVLAIMLKKVVIDMDQRQIFLKSGLFQAGANIRFEDILHFQLASVKQNFITINTSLNVLYVKDGKEKSLGIAEGFTVGVMQRVLNEIEEIMYPDEHKRTI